MRKTATDTLQRFPEAAQRRISELDEPMVLRKWIVGTTEALIGSYPIERSRWTTSGLTADMLDYTD